MATRAVNTMAEGLQNVISSIAMMKIAPDADLPFLLTLEREILSYMKQPQQNLQGQLPPSTFPSAAQTPQGPSGQPAGVGGGMGGMMPSPMAARLGPGGPPTGPPSAGPPMPPNMDELSRMLSQ